jgi:hypothetical protein
MRLTAVTLTSERLFATTLTGLHIARLGVLETEVHLRSPMRV